MHDWHHDWKTDIGLRLCGTASCGISYLAIHSLVALRVANGQLPQGALPFFLAAVGFLCASGGAVLLGLGHHIFDQVEISERWRTKPPAESLSARLISRADSEMDILLVSPSSEPKARITGRPSLKSASMFRPPAPGDEQD